MEDAAIALVAAVAGAVVGGLLTWWAQHREEEGRSRRRADQALQDKLHQLELRIVRLEAETHAFVIQGQARVKEFGGEPDA